MNYQPLARALSWAVATLIFNRFSHHLSALQMTLTKGVIAATLMGLTLWLWPEPLHDLPFRPAAFLALSGFIGIAIGDSAYFAALRRWRTAPCCWNHWHRHYPACWLSFCWAAHCPC